MKFRKYTHPTLPRPPSITGGSEPYIQRCAEPPQPVPTPSTLINMHKQNAGDTESNPSAPSWPQ